MSNLPNPHDAIFKALLSDVAIARDFFEAHLPAHLKPYCDLSTLQLAPGSFVKADLRQQFSDILYALNIAGQKGYLYILIEHLSKAKLLTPFQVLGYQIDAMRQHLNQGHEKLPVIIPLLFYRGSQSPYPAPVDIFECFDQPELARKVFLSPIQLIDLSIIPDEELKTHKSVALLELLQKHMLGRDIMELAHYLIDQLLYRPLPVDQFKSVLEYVQRVGKCADQKAFIRFLEQSHVDPAYKKAMETVAEYLEQRGEQRGYQKGYQSALQATYSDAWRASKIEDAREMLAAKLDIELIKRITKLTDDDLGV